MPLFRFFNSLFFYIFSKDDRWIITFENKLFFKKNNYIEFLIKLLFLYIYVNNHILIIIYVKIGV